MVFGVPLAVEGCGEFFLVSKLGFHCRSFLQKGVGGTRAKPLQFEFDGSHVNKLLYLDMWRVSS